MAAFSVRCFTEFSDGTSAVDEFCDNTKRDASYVEEFIKQHYAASGVKVQRVFVLEGVLVLESKNAVD